METKGTVASLYLINQHSNNCTCAEQQHELIAAHLQQTGFPVLQTELCYPKVPFSVETFAEKSHPIANLQTVLRNP